MAYYHQQSGRRPTMSRGPSSAWERAVARDRNVRAHGASIGPAEGYEELRRIDWAFTARDVLIAIIAICDAGEHENVPVMDDIDDEMKAALKAHGCDLCFPDRHRIPLADIDVDDDVNLSIGLKMLARYGFIFRENAEGPIGDRHLVSVDIDSTRFFDLLRDKIASDVKGKTRYCRDACLAARARHHNKTKEKS